MADNKKKISVVRTILTACAKALVFALILLLFYFGISNAYSFGSSVFAGDAISEKPGVDRTVEIQKGISAFDIGVALEEEGLIVDGNVFWVQSIFYDLTVYPGIYKLNTSMTSKEILTAVSQKPEETQTETEAETVLEESSEEEVEGE